MSYPTTKFTEDALISEVRKYAVLYDRSHPHYKKNHVRETAWENIAATLQYDCEKCKKRWRTLRDTFIKSRKNEKIATWNKAGKKTRPWHLHEQMQFLVQYLDRPEGFTENTHWSKESGEDEGEKEEEYYINHTTSPGSPSSLVSNSEEEHSIFIPSIEMNCDSNCSTSNKRIADTPTNHKQKKMRIPVDAVPDFTACSQNSIGILSPGALLPQQNPDTLFMLSQVESLSKLSPQKNRLAKIKIQQLLYDLEFGGSSLSDANPTLVSESETKGSNQH